MRTIPNLEIHVAHACNLACESCSHYSNHAHKGILALADATRWMGDWHKRLRPKIFTLLGGEPAVNPDLSALVRMTRAHWPDSLLRLVTNGFLLERHPDLPAALRDAGNVRVEVSIHHESAEYLDRLRPATELMRNWPREVRDRVVFLRSAKSWTRRYHGYGSAMQPFQDGQPRQSWERCPAKYCAQIHDGKIWKCAPLAYLGMQNEKHPLSESWSPYLKYRPLAPDCSDAELNAFFNREEESACGMCPAAPERLAMPMPLRSMMRVPRKNPTEESTS